MTPRNFYENMEDIKMEEKKVMQKTKEWIKEHKEGLVRFGYYSAGFAVGCFITDKISDYRIGNGIAKFHLAGIIKFFDPSTGDEISIMEANKILKDMISKKQF